MQAEARRFVSRLHDHWKPEMFCKFRASSRDAEIRGGNPGVAQKILRDHLVECKRMTERAGAGVRHACHLEHGRDMGIPGLALNAVGHVEYHPGRAAFRVRRHEALYRPEQGFVAFAKQYFMTTTLQCFNHLLNGCGSVAFGTILTE